MTTGTKPILFLDNKTLNYIFAYGNNYNAVFGVNYLNQLTKTYNIQVTNVILAEAIGERKILCCGLFSYTCYPKLQSKIYCNFRKVILNGTIKVSGGLLGAIGVAANDNHIVKLAKAA